MDARIVTSTANERVKLVRSILRGRERHDSEWAVAEGIRLVEDALLSGVRPNLVLIDESQLTSSERGRALVDRIAAIQDAEIVRVTERVMSSLSETVSPQGIVAVFRVPSVPVALSLGRVALVLDGVRDPGNLGTILRSAEASGVVKTVLMASCADPWAPKVLRSAMGAHFRLEIVTNLQWSQIRDIVGARPIWLATMEGGTSYDGVPWEQACALVMGGEASGASEEATKLVTGTVSIPMASSAESLNVGVAAGILLFEASRHIRLASTGVEPTDASSRVVE